MNYQTSQLKRIVNCWMLLVQASKDISQPGQAYKMGILEKMVDGLKFILRLIWWTLRVYLFGHLDQWYEWSNWSQHWKNYLFHTFQSLGSWPIGSRVITGFLQLLGSLGSLVFYLFLVSVSFTVTMWLRECEVQENGIAHKYKWQKSETYIRNQTYKQLV